MSEHRERHGLYDRSGNRFNRTRYRSANGTVGYKSDYIEHCLVQLECVFFGPFRDATGEKTVHHETDAETVSDLLVELESTYPALEERLVADEASGQVSDAVVTKNKRNVSHIDGLETSLEEGDVIRLVPSVYVG